MIDFFVGDVDVHVKQLERDNVLSIALIRVVRVAYHVPKHNPYVLLGVLKGVQLSDENSSILVLLSDIVDSFFGAYCFARGVGSNIEENPRLLLCPD